MGVPSGNRAWNDGDEFGRVLGSHSKRVSLQDERVLRSRDVEGSSRMGAVPLVNMGFIFDPDGWKESDTAEEPD